MFSLEDIKEFLKELELTINEENIKWAYETLIKETKAFIKMREFEETFEEDIYDECCCNEGCECCDNDCVCDCCFDECKCEANKCKCDCCCKK